MRVLVHRALQAVAGVAVILTAAASLPAFAADVSGITAPEPRLAGSFALDLPVVLPATSTGPRDLLRDPTGEIAGALFVGDGVAVDTAVNVDVGRMLDRYVANADAYDGLFYSSAALNSPYATLSSGGSYIGMSMALADGLHFTLGRASSAPGLNPYRLDAHSAYAALAGRLPFDPRSTDSVLAGLAWNFAKWGGFSFSASQTAERGGILGAGNPALGGRTQSLGVSAHVGFGGGWVTTASYSEGLTQLSLRPGALALDTMLRSESYGIAVAKHGLFGRNDALGVTFARPAPSFTTQFASEPAANDMQFFGRDKLFAGTVPETDVELGYKTEFFGDSIALQANASYQMNLGGLPGNNAVSLLSRAKIKF